MSSHYNNINSEHAEENLQQSPALTPRSTGGHANNPNLSPGVTRIDAVKHLDTADVDSNKPTFRDATNKSVCIFYF